MFGWLKDNAWSHVDFSAPFQARWKSAAAVGAALGVIGLLAAWRRSDALGWGGALGASLWIWALALSLAAAIMLPVVGRHAYCGVMGVTGLIGAGLSLVMLLILFYGVFSPVSAAMRLLSKDLLRRREFSPGKTPGAFWTKHPGPAPKERYHHLS